MRNFFVLLFLTVGLTQHAQAADPPHASFDIEYPNQVAAITALQSKPGVKFREENNWTVAADSAANTFWSISTRGNPAHPSIVKRVLYEQDGTIRLSTRIFCGAQSEACERMVTSFKESSAELVKQAKKGAR
jgi:hypothetical protein